MTGVRGVWIGCAASLVLATACSSQAQQAPPDQAVPVRVGAVQQREVPVQLQVIGRVEPLSTVEVRAQVGGVLQQVHFEEGDMVKKGELLFTIDPRPFEAALREAEANLSKDQIQLANAREVQNRYTDLVKKEYVTQEEYSRISSVAAALEANMRADEARVANAKLQLDYCLIRSPIHGRTGRLEVHAGNLVKANADTPLITINQVDPISVGFSVPEQQLAEIRARREQGRLVTMALPSGDTGEPLTGELSFLDNQVDPRTGTILLKATFSNAAGRLWPGQFVDVTLRLALEPAALVVPSEAIQAGQQGTFVFVVKQDATVESRPITAGRGMGTETVVTQGLQAGETVVTDGQLRLVPGSKVEILK